MVSASDEYVKQALRAVPEALQPSVSLWLERSGGKGLQQLADTSGRQSMIAGLLKLVACSEFAGNVLLHHSDWFAAEASGGGLAHAQPVGEVPTELDEAAFMKWLRDRRNRLMLGILWRDFQGIVNVSETLTALSALADELIIASAGYAQQQLSERFGNVRDDDGDIVPLVVLAMGKLGGYELNVSSDVDLIFLYPRDGDSDGPRSLSAQEYFARLARRVVALLEEMTADGFVYRVDTRLRPFGDSGPPVVSFTALESYLVNNGRNWERYAYVKARTVTPAGNEAVREALHTQLIEPFVYRRYLDFGVFEALRDMKALIAADVRRREMMHNVKLGPGGIREIEFIVQSLQLVRGGRMPQLQSTGLRKALSQLRHSRGLTRAASDGLDASYCFLRRVENMLQAMRDQQTHDLPENSLDRARLAFALGYDGWETLLRAIDQHRDFVSKEFASVAFRTDGDSGSKQSELERVLAEYCEVSASADAWQALFEDHGYSDAAELANEIKGFLEARSTRQIDVTAGKRLYALLPVLLGLLQSRRQPGLVLKRLLSVLTAVLRRSAYVALLNENAAVRSRLVDLCEQSAYLAEEIARFPLLLDEMLDPRLYSARLSAQSLRDDLTERLVGLDEDDSERQVEALAEFQRAALFRIAAADFSRQLPIMKVSDRLTDLAEIVLDRALEIAWRDLTVKFGRPCCVVEGRQRIAGLGVIAYGKLGGIELSYRSDLDLVFLHDSAGDGQQTDGKKSIDNDLFFVRLARRLVHFLTVQTASGALYEVDTRLRPSGNAGLLVISVEAFERYQAENAWTWEHQALLRARPVAGSARIARQFEDIRARTLAQGVDRKGLRDDVRGMRRKMRTQLDRSDSETFDLKQGEGGIGDIEFLVQYLVLLNANRQAAVMHYSDNIRQLGTLSAAGCIDADDASRLQEIYRIYRTQLHHLSLDERQALVAASDFKAERAFVCNLWQRVIG